MSPNELFGSASRARTYALVSDPMTPSPKLHVWRIVASTSPAIATPAGDTCLNDVAAGESVAALASRTSCQAFNASRRLIIDGLPCRTRTEPSAAERIRALWCGFMPYRRSIAKLLGESTEEHPGVRRSDYPLPRGVPTQRQSQHQA